MIECVRVCVCMYIGRRKGTPTKRQNKAREKQKEKENSTLPAINKRRNNKIETFNTRREAAVTHTLFLFVVCFFSSTDS